MTVISELEKKLASVSTVQQRVDIMNQLAWELIDRDNKRGLSFAQSAFELAQAESYEKGIADSLIAQCQFDYTDYVHSLSQGMKFLSLFEKINDRRSQFNALFTICWAHWGLDNFAESLEAGLHARRLAQSMGDSILEADINNNIGLAQKRSGNYEACFSMYDKALNTYRLFGDDLRACKVLTNIALAYITQNKFEDALKYAQEAVSLDVKNTLISGYSHLALGQIFTGIKRYENVMEHLQIALRVGDELETQQLTLSALYSIGLFYKKQSLFEESIDYFKQAIVVGEKIKSNLFIFQCHEALSQVYEQTGDTSLAFHYFKKFHMTKEAVFNDKNVSRLQSLEIHRQTEIARHEAEVYHLRNIELEREISERRRLEERLQEQANIDDLTGVANRRYFMRMASRELAHALKMNRNLSLAIMDIDHFKHINDQYGHAWGDRALHNFASIIKASAREVDLFARFGGDEFILLLPSIGHETAIKILERLCKQVSLHPIAHNDSEVFITISIGLAHLRGENDTLDALLERADRALYKAKDLGRNYVCVE